MDNATIEQRIGGILIDELGVEEQEITRDAHLVNDLGADSLDIIEIACTVEEEFDVDISDAALPTITTVGELCDVVAKLKG